MQDNKGDPEILETINYYRSFIPRCSTIALPLSEFIAKKTPGRTEQTKTFNDLKRALISAPLIVPFSPEREYQLTTDVSNLRPGAVIEELSNNRVSGVVGYFSNLCKAPKITIQLESQKCWVYRKSPLFQVLATQ